MLDVSRHVEAEEHGVARIHAGDLVAGNEVALSSRKYEHLAPFRSGLLSGRGGLVFEAGRDSDEILALDDARRKLPGLRADLGSLDRALRRLAVVGIVEEIRQIALQLIAIGFVAARLHDPIDDIKPLTGIAKTAPRVQKTSGSDTGCPCGIYCAWQVNNK